MSAQVHSPGANTNGLHVMSLASLTYRDITNDWMITAGLARMMQHELEIGIEQTKRDNINTLLRDADSLLTSKYEDIRLMARAHGVQSFSVGDIVTYATRLTLGDPVTMVCPPFETVFGLKKHKGVSKKQGKLKQLINTRATSVQWADIRKPLIAEMTQLRGSLDNKVYRFKGLRAGVIKAHTQYCVAANLNSYVSAPHVFVEGSPTLNMRNLEVLKQWLMIGQMHKMTEVLTACDSFLEDDKPLILGNMMADAGSQGDAPLDIPALFAHNMMYGSLPSTPADTWLYAMGASNNQRGLTHIMGTGRVSRVQVATSYGVDPDRLRRNSVVRGLQDAKSKLTANKKRLQNIRRANVLGHGGEDNASLHFDSSFAPIL